MRDSTNIPETWQHTVDWRSCQNIVFLFVRDSLTLVQYCLNRPEAFLKPCTICTHRDTAAVQLPQSQRDGAGRPEQPCRGTEKLPWPTNAGQWTSVFHRKKEFFVTKTPKFSVSFWKHYHWWANLLREEIQTWKISHSSSKRETYLGENRYAEKSDSCS